METILPKGPLCHLLNTGIVSHCALIYTGNVGSSDLGLTCAELTAYLIWLPFCFYQIFLSGELALWRTMPFVGGHKEEVSNSYSCFHRDYGTWMYNFIREEQAERNVCHPSVHPKKIKNISLKIISVACSLILRGDMCGLEQV